MPLHPVRPMMALSAPRLPTGEGWTYEVKWDGYRAQILKDRDRVTLRSRNLKELTTQFPQVVAAGTDLRAQTAIVDGEIVALDSQGRPSFQSLHHAETARLSVVFYAFDLLYLDGRDLTRAPLDERRRRLARVVAKTPVLLSEPLPGDPAAIEQAVRAAGLEGVVAKRRESLYEAGRRSGVWVKVKFSRRQEFVVGGYKPSGPSFDSIVVGYYQGTRLHSAGKVRSGFTPRTRAQLMSRLLPLAADRCPFVNLPASRTGHWGEGITADDMGQLRWVRPELVVEVAFTEWTRDGSLRHASYVAMRDDSRPRDVHREATSTDAPS